MLHMSLFIRYARSRLFSVDLSSAAAATGLTATQRQWALGYTARRTNKSVSVVFGWGARRDKDAHGGDREVTVGCLSNTTVS